MLELDFQLQRGSYCLEVDQVIDQPVTGVIGSSGSGKSTLLGVIAGLIKPQRGRISLDKQVLLDTNHNIYVPAHRRRIGLVFQDGQLLPHLTVEQNLLYGYHNLAEGERQFSPGNIIELLEIGSLLRRQPRSLSGGEQQRVALGRAILYSPHLLLLDEPLSALDERLKQQILSYLQEIKTQLGVPMLYVTHATHELQYLADDILTIEAGYVRKAKMAAF